MSKISRITQKIFASSAGLDQRKVFGSLAAGAPVTSTDPTTIQSLSNWITGWYDAVIGGNAPTIEDMNSLHFVQTYNIAYALQAGVPEWHTDQIYYIGSFCQVAGVLYVSKTDDNTGNLVTDTANWKPYSTEPVGTGKDYWGSTLPSGGYVWASGKTIGNASSNGTERANVDTLDLFTLLWNSTTNTELPIYTSAGVGSIRGASAAADFAANKALSLPDKRGRVSVGKDDLGGTAANRVTTANGLNGTIIGMAGGEQVHILAITEIPAHNHGGGAHTHLTVVNQAANQSLTGGNAIAYNGSVGGGDTDYVLKSGGGANPTLGLTSDSGAIIASQGSGDAHQNMQPSIVCNYIIKL